MRLLKTFGLLAFVCFMASPALAQSYNLHVYEGSGNQADVILSFRTIRIYTSMCPINVADVQINKKTISIATAPRKPSQMCMMASGPHTGSVVLGIDDLNVGFYSVFINGEHNGSVYFNGKTLNVVEAL